MLFTNSIKNTLVALVQLMLASSLLVSSSPVASQEVVVAPVVTYVLFDEEKKCPGESFSIDCITESYANNLTTPTQSAGTVIWEDSGTNGVVSLTTTGNSDQAQVFLPVIPLGFTYPNTQAINSIEYQLTSTSDQSAVFNVELARTIFGPYCTVQHIPAPASAGSINAYAGQWKDRCDGGNILADWAAVQAEYSTDWAVNKVFLSLGTGQDASTSKIDHVTINGSDFYDFVYTGMPGGADLGPEYKNPLTVQEENGATVNWTKPGSTNGAVTLATFADDDQAVVNLPILPLGIEFAELNDITAVAIDIAENTNHNASFNIQVYEDPIAGPFHTVQYSPLKDSTGEFNAIPGSWFDRTIRDQVTWATIITRYGTLPVNRIWLSLGSGNGVSSSSIDSVTINSSEYDFVTD